MSAKPTVTWLDGGWRTHCQALLCGCWLEAPAPLHVGVLTTWWLALLRRDALWEKVGEEKQEEEQEEQEGKGEEQKKERGEEREERECERARSR